MKKFTYCAENIENRYSVTFYDRNGCKHQFLQNYTLKELYKKITSLQREGCVIKKVKEVKK